MIGRFMRAVELSEMKKANKQILLIVIPLLAYLLLWVAIPGGAVLPPLQGFIADITRNLQISFIVPLVAYAYVAFYGAKGHRLGKPKSIL
jgi:hypothetical protein